MKRRRFIELLSMGGLAAVHMAFKEWEIPAQDQDCIVIGSGPIGVASAIKLAENGKRVLVLEAGDAISQPAGSHFRNQPKFEENPDSYFDAISPFLKTFTDSQNTVLPGLADSNLYGGQGVIWTNNCPRASEFELWKALPSKKWDDRYSEAEKALGVNPDPSANSFTGNTVKSILQKNLKNGRHIRGLPFSGKVDNDGNTYFNAPWDMLNKVQEKVYKRIQIRSNTKVLKIIHDKGQVRGVSIKGPNRQNVTLKTSNLLMACGAVGTPQLLINSGIMLDALGKGFSFHSLYFGQIIINSEFAAPASERDLPTRLWIPPTEKKPWHIQVLRDTFPIPTNEAVKNSNRLLEFQAFLPIEYREENTLVFTEGSPTVVQFNFSDNDKYKMKEVEKDIEKLANSIGRWRKGGEPVWIPQGTAHLVGTCRMDLPDWKGVADNNGQVHGFKNLYIASVGLIPCQVAVNPTLTAAALALNTVDEILRQTK
ncbi:MAG TPA: GMC oxidoreductase [Flavobacteriaceae bacterium]|nr:GMC oxidoreductase [Flavobacteriaceae bacterium]